MHIGKMLLLSCLLKCAPPVLTVAAALCSSSKTGGPFIFPTHNRGEAHEARRRFASCSSSSGAPPGQRLVGGEYSDLITIVNAYNAWDALGADADSSSGAGAGTAANTASSAKTGKTLFPCKFFMSPGGCRSGENCKFPHVGGNGDLNGAAAPMSRSDVNAAKRQFCVDNFLSQPVLEEMKLLREYFRRHLESIGFLYRPAPAPAPGVSGEAAGSSSGVADEVGDDIDFAAAAGGGAGESGADALRYGPDAGGEGRPGEAGEQSFGRAAHEKARVRESCRRCGISCCAL
jgi:hypothetical protein